MAKVGIIMGSKSDLPIMQEAIDILNEFGIQNDVDIVSAHRTPEKMMKYGENAHKKGYSVIIAGAGGAAAVGVSARELEGRRRARAPRGDSPRAGGRVEREDVSALAKSTCPPGRSRDGVSRDSQQELYLAA